MTSTIITLEAAQDEMYRRYHRFGKAGRREDGICEVWCGPKSGEGKNFYEAFMDFDTQPSSDELRKFKHLHKK